MDFVFHQKVMWGKEGKNKIQAVCLLRSWQEMTKEGTHWKLCCSKMVRRKALNSLTVNAAWCCVDLSNFKANQYRVNRLIRALTSHEPPNWTENWTVQESASKPKETILGQSHFILVLISLPAISFFLLNYFIWARQHFLVLL